MILVFIVYPAIILCIIALLISIVMLSTIKINLKEISLSNINKTENKIKIEKEKENENKNADKKIKISLYLMNKIKWMSFSFSINKIKKSIRKIKGKKIKSIIKNTNMDIFENLDVKISELDLKIKIGTDNVILTSFVVYAISSIISFILPKFIKKDNQDKQKYKVSPIYENKNLYDINVNCIIEVKIVHIIDIIYILLKERRKESNDKRTSNRRSYGYGYE